jgi:hypothetical protein
VLKNLGFQVVVFLPKLASWKVGINILLELMMYDTQFGMYICIKFCNNGEPAKFLFILLYVMETL